MNETQTIQFKPVILPPSSEQRFRTVQVYLSLMRLFDEIGEPSKASHWRIQAKALGWREEFEL